MTSEDAIKIGGKAWNDRVYFNDLPDLLGVTVRRYNTGNISSCCVRGEWISNFKGAKLVSRLSACKLWVESGEFYHKGLTEDEFAIAKAALASRLPPLVFVERA